MAVEAIEKLIEELKLETLERACGGLELLELDSLTPFAGQALSGRERARLESLGERRQRSFLGSRIALKRLARALGARGEVRELETLAAGGIRPRCPVPVGHPARFATAAHDARFAVAAAASRPLGIDVEPEGERALRVERLFLSPDERTRIAASPLGRPAATLRAWCLKESAAKALDVPLSEASRRTRLIRVEAGSCLAQIDGQERRASCASLDGHLFCLLVL
ncbi:MAG: 4'-phosphopantetheinyl transferase superfamily protein [Deltaproteobacteria bacterium]|nr:4'-phosphopantetheinyl transferase superfamily protein [Deltaproteobacteria bacterium]